MVGDLVDRFKIINSEKINELYEKSFKDLDNIVPLVIICGPGKCDENIECKLCTGFQQEGCMYNLRRELKRYLNDNNCLAATFEEDFNLKLASLEEQIILKEEEVDLVIIIPCSIGASAELGLFSKDPQIRKKLRVIVPSEFHPFYCREESFLTSVYMELLSDYGHVYPFGAQDSVHPSAELVIGTLVESYRLKKLLRSKELNT